jgi:hypothetical protein
MKYSPTNVWKARFVQYEVTLDIQSGCGAHQPTMFANVTRAGLAPDVEFFAVAGWVVAGTGRSARALIKRFQLG